MLPNERFTGGGHRIHVCRKCQRLPTERRAELEAEQEVSSFLFRQSHISAKNVERLRDLERSASPIIRAKATAALAVALVAPYKRKRYRVLRRERPDLLGVMQDVGFLAEGVEGMEPGLGAEADDVSADRDTLLSLDSEDELPF